MLFRPKQPNFSVFERHAELTERVRVDWEDREPSSSPDLNPLDYHMLEKYNKLQPKPKTTRELKALADPLEKNCHKSTSTRRWQTSFSVWLPTWLWLRMVVTPCICSSSVQVCILISSPINKLALSRAINKLPVKTTLGMPRNEGGGCLGWIIFTALHWMQTRSSDENSVCPSVGLSNACIVTKRKKDLSRFFTPYEISFSLVSEKKNGWWVERCPRNCD